MSKVKAPADYNHVTPAMLDRAKAVVYKADMQHRYSVSEIYPIHNAVFKLNAQQETCSTCLTNRVRDLRAFIKAYEPATPTVDSSAATLIEAPDEMARITNMFETYMKERGVGSHSTREEQYNALLAFQEAHLTDIPENQQQAFVDEVAALEKELRNPPTYTALAQRFSLYDADDEAAVIRELLAVDPDDGYNLTTAEAGILNDRLAELEARVKVDTGAAEGMDPNFPEYKEPATGVTRYPTGEGLLPIDFTPSADDPTKGTVLYADGSKVKAATYSTATGQEIAVQPGGKASLKEVDLT